MNEQTIFITGGASGIGRATAEYFHERGWFVGCFDLNESALRELERQLEDRVLVGLLDVTDKEAFDSAMASFSEATGGRLDIMFNNAGIAVAGFLDELPFQKVVDMVNINLLGVLNGVHAAIPLLKQTANSLCCSTSSSSATFGTPGMATYAATKYAVKGLTEAMSVELARYGARAADVSPGIIDTSLWQGEAYAKGEPRQIIDLPRMNAARTDASRTLGPETVAACVWDAYHGDKVHWYVPPELYERDKAKVLDPQKLRDELIAGYGW